jgi:hypothetical protein
VDKDEKGSLKRIVGVVGVGEHTAAHAPDHAAVPPNQSGERGLLAVGNVALQQMRVG